jgi:hypothetical protein
MAYKISGTVSHDADIYVIDEGTDLLEAHQVQPAGEYTIENLSEGAKIVTAMANDGRVLGYGNVTPIYSVTYEDFTTYTEATDYANDVTVAENTVSFNTMARTAHAKVYYDYGSGNLTSNMQIEFEAQITESAGSNGAAYLLGISNTIGNGKQCDDANDHIFVRADNGISNLEFNLSCSTTDNWDTYVDGGTTSALLYFTFTRNGSTVTLQIYSDVNRQNLIDTLSVTSTTESKRYLYAVQGWGQASGITSTTGTVRNFNIVYLN